MRITAATRLVALLGDPVSHSLSPLIQNAAFQAAGVDAVYLAMRCSRAGLAGMLDGIARTGGAGNVTVPHKASAARAVELCTPAVERTGACNTFWFERGRVHGDNTDVAGFAGAVGALAGDVTGARVLLLGAGGAARAAACALLDAGVASITVANRTAGRAAELCDRLDPEKRRMSSAALRDCLIGAAWDLVVNATTVGMNDMDPEPADLTRLAHVGAVLDLVYRPGGTAWTRSAAVFGIRAADGREMLLLQGAAAFERWFDQAAPLDAMRAALGAAR